MKKLLVAGIVVIGVAAVAAAAFGWCPAGCGRKVRQDAWATSTDRV